MHEFGVAQELVSAVDRTVRAHGGGSAARVVIALHPGAAEEESLRSAFDAAKRHSTAEGAELSVEWVPVEVYCLDCGATTVVGNAGDLACPECGSTACLAGDTPGVTLKSVEIRV